MNCWGQNISFVKIFSLKKETKLSWHILLNQSPIQKRINKIKFESWLNWTDMSTNCIWKTKKQQYYINITFCTCIRCFITASSGFCRNSQISRQSRNINKIIYILKKEKKRKFKYFFHKIYNYMIHHNYQHWKNIL